MLRLQETRKPKKGGAKKKLASKEIGICAIFPQKGNSGKKKDGRKKDAILKTRKYSKLRLEKGDTGGSGKHETWRGEELRGLRVRVLHGRKREWVGAHASWEGVQKVKKKS